MTPNPSHPSVAPPTAIEIAARCIAVAGNHTMIAPFGDKPWSPNSMRIAEALAEAGLLYSDVDRAVLDDLTTAVVDAAIAETLAEQGAVRRTTAALDAPSRSSAITAAGDATRAARAARQARQDAVTRLLQHRQGHE